MVLLVVFRLAHLLAKNAIKRALSFYVCVFAQRSERGGIWRRRKGARRGGGQEEQKKDEARNVGFGCVEVPSAVFFLFILILSHTWPVVLPAIRVPYEM